MSWCTIWYHHLSFPVCTSSATIDAVNRFLPARELPLLSGPALPVVKYSVPSSGSTDGVCQTGAPPAFQASFDCGHVSWPVSPGPGIV